MTILPTLALRSFVGFDNLFNELETISTQKQNSFPAHDIIRLSDDEYEITFILLNSLIQQLRYKSFLILLKYFLNVLQGNLPFFYGFQL